MAVSHVKSDIIADVTGTATIWFGATTQTIAASDLVRPSDWNSVHNEQYTLSGNTSNASTVSGTNVVFQAAGGLTITGSSDSIIFNATRPGTLSRYVSPAMFIPVTSHGSHGQNNVSFKYVPLEAGVTVTELRALFQFLMGSSANNSTNTIGITLQAGIYTRTGSTISLASSGSQSFSATWSSNGHTASINGLRQITTPLNANMSAGEYWIALRMSTSSSRNPGTINGFAHSGQQTANAIVPPLGVASATSHLFFPFHGVYSATSAAIPASATLNEIVGSGNSYSVANFPFDLQNYTVV